MALRAEAKGGGGYGARLPTLGSNLRLEPGRRRSGGGREGGATPHARIDLRLPTAILGRLAGIGWTAFARGPGNFWCPSARMGLGAAQIRRLEEPISTQENARCPVKKMDMFEHCLFRG